MHRLSVRTLLLGFALIATLVCAWVGVTGLMAVWRMSGAADRQALLQESLRLHREADAKMDALQAVVLRAAAASSRLTHEKPEAIRANFTDAAKILAADIEANRRAGLSPDVTAGYQKVASLAADGIKAAGDAMDASLAKPGESAAQFDAFNSRFDNLQTAMDGNRDRLQEEVAAAKADNDSVRTWIWRLLPATFGFGLLLLFGAALLLARTILDLVKGMATAMTELASGAALENIPGAGRADEFGGMARAIDVFRNARDRAERMEGEQASERTARQRRAEQIERLVGAFQSGVGSLTGQLAASSAELNATAQSLSGTAQQTGRQAGSAAAAVSEAGAGVQTVAAAAEQLTASIGEISRQVTQSARITHAAVEDVRRTDRIVHSLEEGASRIGDVVGLITTIAGQTNLLALNATIEAARAGDAGKGFAVVASEVKNLAQQTGRATEEIGGQVSQIQAATRDAVAAIQGISKTIEQVSAIATTIAAAVEEQGAATAEIARNVQLTSASTDQVGRTLTELSGAANATDGAAGKVLSIASVLSRQAEQLNGEVGGFIVNVRAA